MTEWLTEDFGLQPGMRVLDLGCGRAASSIFLHREFGVQVWAADLWFDASENLRRIEDAGVGHAVFPIQADARSLPFANEFFDAVIVIDSLGYYGTDIFFLRHLARHVKPGGLIGFAGAGLVEELNGPVPGHLQPWWEPGLWSLHSAAWWKQHWERSGMVDVEKADRHPNGGALWLEWLRTVHPENAPEIQALEADAGRCLGYVRVIGRRRAGVEPEPRQISIPAHYEARPLLREPRMAAPQKA
jgi:SAM-dependent methyltransferase